MRKKTLIVVLILTFRRLVYPNSLARSISLPANLGICRSVEHPGLYLLPVGGQYFLPKVTKINNLSPKIVEKCLKIASPTPVVQVATPSENAAASTASA